MPIAVPHNRLQIKQRRDDILVLLTKGMKGYEIPKELGVDASTLIASHVKLDVNIIIKLMMDDAAMSMNSTNVLLNEAEKASMIHQISEKFNGSQRIREFIKYDHPDPFFKQQRAKLNRLARNEPEIEDHELEEDLNRMNQRSRRTTITKQSQSHRSKRQQKLKAKAH